MEPPVGPDLETTVYVRASSRDHALRRARETLSSLRSVSTAERESAVDNLDALAGHGLAGASDNGRVRVAADTRRSSRAAASTVGGERPPDAVVFGDLAHDAGSPVVLRHWVRNLLQAGIGVHCIARRTEITEEDLAVLSVGVAAGQERFQSEVAGKQARARVREGGGRPALGYRATSGEWAPTDDFAAIVCALDAVDRGAVSKRRAADRIGCSRSTITRAIEDRPELYGLDAGGEEGGGQTRLDAFA